MGTLPRAIQRTSMSSVSRPWNLKPLLAIPLFSCLSIALVKDNPKVHTRCLGGDAYKTLGGMTFINECSSPAWQKGLPAGCPATTRGALWVHGCRETAFASFTLLLQTKPPSLRAPLLSFSGNQGSGGRESRGNYLGLSTGQDSCLGKGVPGRPPPRTLQTQARPKPYPRPG